MRTPQKYGPVVPHFRKKVLRFSPRPSLKSASDKQFRRILLLAPHAAIFGTGCG
jgi:hypothetical protein